MPDLSVLIVNYNSGWFCANYVESLRDQVFYSPTGARGELEIIIVDNASPMDQHEYLDPLKGDGVKVIYSQDNSGYSGGSNLAMQSVTSDYVLISNPDVIVLPGALDRLLAVLYADPGIGMAGPRGWLEPGLHFLLPPMEIPTVRDHLLESAGRVHPGIGRRFSLARSRRALESWDGEGVYRSEAISGYCALMPSALARELGPFDPTFPLYYEDIDLSFRVAKAGYGLAYVKDALALHFYNKSAGSAFEESLQKFDWSKSYFFGKHYSKLHHLLYRKSTDFLKKRMHRLKGSLFESFQHLGAQDQVPDFGLPRDRPLLIELTLDPAFVVSAGHLHPGGEYRIPEITWEALDGATYFLRAIDRADHKTLAAFQWDKTTPARVPPTYGELKGRFS